MALYMPDVIKHRIAFRMRCFACDFRMAGLAQRAKTCDKIIYLGPLPTDHTNRIKEVSFSGNTIKQEEKEPGT